MKYWIAVILVTASLCEAQSVAPRQIAGVDYVSTLKMPHRWAVDFVKRGNHLFVSGSESERTFLVVDVSDPRAMKVVAETEAGMYAGRNLCLKDNLALVNHYAWINPVDITDPTRPELQVGCCWQPDREGSGIRMYRFQAFGKHLFVVCNKPQLALRVYEMERLFSPRLVATVDLADKLDDRAMRIMGVQRNWYPNAEIIVAGTMLHTSFGPFIAGFDISQPAAPKVVYCHAMPQNVVGLALAGRTLFVAMNSRIIGKRDEPGEDAAVAAVDLSAPAAPRVVGEYKDMEVPERMLVSGNTLYLVGEEKTPPEARNLNGVPFTRGFQKAFARRVALHVLDITNPARPARRATLAFPLRMTLYGDCACRAMAFDNGVLFVADQDYGIRSVDVRNPSQPKLLGGLRTVSHEVRRVIPDGNRIYIVNGSSLHGADVTDPRRPQFDLEGCLSSISRWSVSQPVFGPNRRYLYSINAGAYEIAIADFGQPRGWRGEVVNLVPLPDGWAARDLGWSGNHLIVLGSQDNRWAVGQLFVFEPTDGGRSLKLVKTVPLGQFKEWLGWVVGTAFLVEKDRVFILQSKRKRTPPNRFDTTALDLVTVDLTNPLAPRAHPPVDLLSLSGDVKPAYHSGEALAYKDGLLYFYALIDDGESYLLIYDVRNPSQPALRGSLKDPVPPTTSWLDRNLCLLSPDPYVACSSEWMGAWIVDVRDPRKPVTAWKEPRSPRQTMIGHYDKIAKPPVAYDNGRLYVPRLDRVDIFQIRTSSLQHSSTPLPQPIARASRARSPVQVNGNAAEWNTTPAVPFGRGPASAKWQWDDKNLYILLTVTDPQVERVPGAMYLPHLYTGDHVDIFLTPQPAAAERPYAPADTHISVDLNGRVEFHHNNPRIRGGQPEWRTTPAKLSRAAVTPTPTGYVMEIALAHEETQLQPAARGRIACSLLVTDRGERQMMLRPAANPGTLAVQPTWPCIELAP